MTTLEQIGGMRDQLEDIRHWRDALSDVMLTISSQALDLTGIRGTTDRIPGGDALAMLGPWAPDADHGDDLPHPEQIMREWVEQIHGERLGSWEEHWRWHWDQTPRILASPWADAWQADITALWWRLARLTGNAPKNEEADLQRRLVDCANELPDHARLTLAQIDTTWPDQNLSQRIRTARSKENARARKENREPRHPVDPDDQRRYLVGDIRTQYPETRPKEAAPTT